MGMDICYGFTYNIKIGDRSFENVAQFKYFGTTVTNQNLIQEEIKRRLNSGNACYHSAQNLLSSRLLSKNVKIRIYKIIIFYFNYNVLELSPYNISHTSHQLFISYRI
jgi:hypothetical protein